MNKTEWNDEQIVENVPESKRSKRKKTPMRPVNLRDFILGVLVTLIIVSVVLLVVYPRTQTVLPPPSIGLPIPSPTMAPFPTMVPTVPPPPVGAVTPFSVQPTVIARRLSDVSIAPDGRTFAIAGQNFDGASAEVRQMAVDSNLSSQRIAYVDPGFEVGKTVFNADGSRIATMPGLISFSGLNVTHIFDTQSGQQLSAFQASDVDFSRDGRWLASVNGATLELRSASSFEVEQTLNLDSMGMLVRFSPDASKIAAVRDTNGAGFVVRVWDMNNLETSLKEYAVQGRFVFDMNFSPNSQLLVLATDPNVQVVDLNDSSYRLWNLDDMRFFAATFSPDGNWLVAGGGNTTGGNSQIAVWNWGETSILNPDDNWYNPMFLYGHVHDVTSLEFMPNNNSQILSSGRDGTIRMWNLETLQQISELRM